MRSDPTTILYKIDYEEITGWWKDTGKVEDLLEANQLILTGFSETRVEGTLEADSKAEGIVIVEKGAYLSLIHI